MQKEASQKIIVLFLLIRGQVIISQAHLLGMASLARRNYMHSLKVTTVR